MHYESVKARLQGLHAAAERRRLLCCNETLALWLAAPMLAGVGRRVERRFSGPLQGYLKKGLAVRHTSKQAKLRCSADFTITDGLDSTRETRESTNIYINSDPTPEAELCVSKTAR